MAAQTNTGGVYISDLLIYLQSLSPSANPYSSTMVWLLERISSPALPDSYGRLAIAFACLFALHFALLTASTLILLVGRGNWIFRWIPNGLWQANPKIATAFFGAAFCGCQVAALIRQTLICAGKLGQRNQILIQGLRWVPLQFGGWLFVHACLCNIIVKGRRLAVTVASPGDSPPASSLRRRISLTWPIWAINILGVAMPTTVTAVVCVSFVRSNKHESTLIDRTRTLASLLTAAASTYNPANFKPDDLEPFFDSVMGIERAHSDMVLWWRIGVGSLAVSILLIAVVFIPFFVRHLALLRRLMGAQPLWRAIVLGVGSVPFKLSLWTAASGSQREHYSSRPRTTGAPLATIVEGDETFATGNGAPASLTPEHLRAHTSPISAQTQGNLLGAAALASPPLRSQGKPEATGLYMVKRENADGLDVQAEYRRLLLTGCALWLGELSYLPVTIWALVTSLESLTFWKGELWLTNLAFFLTVFFVNIFFNYLPAWRQLRRWLRPEPSPVSA